MRRFHVHIYFDLDQMAKARSLADRSLQAGLFEHVEIYDRAVGPHPKAMVEAHFIQSSFEAVLKWIEENRGEFSALVHRDTGDDVRDHTDGIVWLGKALPLDFTFFELVRRHPELSVHRQS